MIHLLLYYSTYVCIHTIYICNCSLSGGVGIGIVLCDNLDVDVAKEKKM